MRPRSLRAIMLVYSGAFIAALLVQRGINYTLSHRAIMHQVDMRIATASADIISAGRRSGPAAMIDSIVVAQHNHDTADLLYLLLDRNGRRLVGNLALGYVPPVGYSDFGQEALVADVSHGRALTRKLTDGSTLIVASDSDEEDDFDALLFRAQLAGLIITILIFLGGVVTITVLIRGRMLAMKRTVDAVIDGNMKSRVAQDNTGGEFDQLAAAFNRMLDLIGELMTNVSHTAKDVTHELKNPLARLRSTIAATRRRAGENPLAPDIDDMLGQTDDILELFNSLLRLWEIEGGKRRERFATLDLAALATDVGQSMQAVAEDEGRPLDLTTDGHSLPVLGDGNLLRQLIVNLIDNALRHTPPGTPITVSTELSNRQARLIVSDKGPGIASGDRPTAIRRFGRLEAAERVPGQGLGLALADAIARLHRGMLALEDAGPGLRVVITLPIANA